MRRVDSPRCSPKKKQNVTPKNKSSGAKKCSSSAGGTLLTNKRKVYKKMVHMETFGGKLRSIPISTLREIKRVQKTDKCLIPRRAFSRLVREIVQENDNGEDIRFQHLAMQCLQEATEIHLSLWFTKLNYLAGHSKRMTVSVPDSRLALILEELK